PSTWEKPPHAQQQQQQQQLLTGAVSLRSKKPAASRRAVCRARVPPPRPQRPLRRSPGSGVSCKRHRFVELTGLIFSAENGKKEMRETREVREPRGFWWVKICGWWLLCQPILPGGQVLRGTSWLLSGLYAPAQRVCNHFLAVPLSSAVAEADRKLLLPVPLPPPLQGSSLDLSSNVLTEFDTAATEPSSASRTVEGEGEGEEADDEGEEDEDEEEEEDLGDLLDPTDIIGRRASASLVGGSSRQSARRPLSNSGQRRAAGRSCQQQKSFSPQHTAAQSASQSFVASRGYQTLPARSKARQPPPPPQQQTAEATAEVQSAALNSSPSLPLSASQCGPSSLRQAACPMPASTMQGAGGSSCSLPVGSGPGGGFDGGAWISQSDRALAAAGGGRDRHHRGRLRLHIAHEAGAGQLFSEDTVNTVFSNLESLCEFHRGLLRRLERHQRSLRDFSQVFVGQPGRLPAVRRLLHKLPQREVQSQSEARAYLSAASKPLELVPASADLPAEASCQRILKYHLLLMKSAPSGDADRHIKAALDGMTGIASDINEVQRRHEHALRVEELKSLLKSAHLDIGSLGELVREDSFRIHGHKGARQVFLFHKAILLTKRLQNGCLAIKEIIRCANLMLIESIPKEQLSFHILPFDNPKCQLTLQARRIDQKAQWCRDIKRLIIENYEATIPEKAKHIVLNMSELLNQNCNGAAAAAAPATVAESQSPPPSGRRRNHSSGRRELHISSPERPAAGLRRKQLDEQLEVAAPLQRSRPVSRCYSSTEDLGDLLRYHEEALKEIFTRTTRCGSSSDSSPRWTVKPPPPLPPPARLAVSCRGVPSRRRLSPPSPSEINEEVLGALRHLS
uniref:DH domain-containing protein n=1 Tax=Macrostomum lignano TaxID=282301 RepID=A0A1I8FTS1_9PLAT